jgi:putative RecB family exonuclease
MIADTTPQTASRRPGGIWDYISPSRLNCWLTCPLRFAIRYIDGIKTPTTPSLFTGKQVHSSLEGVYRHRMLGVTLPVDDVLARIDETWEQAVAEEDMSFETTDQEATLKQQVANLVRAYLEQVPPDEPRPAAVEANLEANLVDPFTGEDLGIPLLGFVDLVLGTDDGPVIIDFKTSARSAPPFEVTHEIQLTSYAWLYRQLTGMCESGLQIRSLVKTKQPKIETHRYPARTDAHFRRLFAVLREYLDALHAGRFNYRPGWGCGMCDFRSSRCSTWAG